MDDDNSRAGDADGERVGGCGRAGNELLGDESAAEWGNDEGRENPFENGEDEPKPSPVMMTTSLIFLAMMRSGWI